MGFQSNMNYKISDSRTIQCLSPHQKYSFPPHWSRDLPLTMCNCAVTGGPVYVSWKSHEPKRERNWCRYCTGLICRLRIQYKLQRYSALWLLSEQGKMAGRNTPDRGRIESLTQNESIQQESGVFTRSGTYLRTRLQSFHEQVRARAVSTLGAFCESEF